MEKDETSVTWVYLKSGNVAVDETRRIKMSMWEIVVMVAEQACMIIGKGEISERERNEGV